MAGRVRFGMRAEGTEFGVPVLAAALCGIAFQAMKGQPSLTSVLRQDAAATRGPCADGRTERELRLPTRESGLAIRYFLLR